MKSKPKKPTLAQIVAELRKIEIEATKAEAAFNADDDPDRTAREAAEKLSEQFSARWDKAMRAAQILVRRSVELPPLSDQEKWPKIAKLMYTNMRLIYGDLHFYSEREPGRPYETSYLNLGPGPFGEVMRWQLDSVDARYLLERLFGFDCDLNSRLWRYLRNRLPVLNQ